MTTLRIIERQLMQRASVPVAPSRESSLQALQAYVDKETAAAVQTATQPLLLEMERLARQVTQLQASLADSKQAHVSDRDRLQREAQNCQAVQNAARDAAAQAHKHQLMQVTQEAETRLTQERDTATQSLRAERDRECKARVQAEAKANALQESNAALMQAMKAIKPSVTHSVREVPVKGKATGYAFEIRRRGDGLIYGVIAKPL